MFGKPDRGLSEIYRFLEIDQVLPDNLAAQEVGTYHELSPDTRRQLEAYFAKPNRDLADLLGEQYAW